MTFPAVSMKGDDSGAVCEQGGLVVYVDFSGPIIGCLHAKSLLRHMHDIQPNLNLPQSRLHQAPLDLDFLCSSRRTVCPA